MQPLEIGANVFPVKYLNIIDPLKESNNLGRSVSKGISKKCTGFW